MLIVRQLKYIFDYPNQLKMRSFKLLLFSAVMAFTVFSCSKSKDELIVGTWHEVETGESIVKYTKNGMYSFDYDNGNSETGKWRIDGKTLYTIAEGSDEELDEEITVLDESKLVLTIGGMFQTTYEREKE